MSIALELEKLEQVLSDLRQNGIIELEVADRIVLDYNRLAIIASAYRTLGYTVVMTIGSFDLLHIGHTRYLYKAKSQGLDKNRKTILIVGVDSDIAIKRYKGPHRPIINATERLEMLSVQRGVDFITIIDDIDNEGRWYYSLLKMIRPDIFVAVQDSYPESQQREIEMFCKALVVLPRQAENTSSSLIIQRVIKSNPDVVLRILNETKGLNDNLGEK